MTKLVNLTPHDITIMGQNGETTVLKSEGLARCQSTSEQVSWVNDIPVNCTTMGEVTGLPAPQEDTMYVVSRVVAEAVAGTRNDILIVDKTVRNDAGQIIGCNAFGVIRPSIEVTRLDYLKVMHHFMIGAGDEDLYYSWATYGMPDEPSVEDYQFVAEDDAEFKDTVECFLKRTKYLVKDGVKIDGVWCCNG